MSLMVPKEGAIELLKRALQINETSVGDHNPLDGILQVALFGQNDSAEILTLDENTTTYAVISSYEIGAVNSGSESDSESTYGLTAGIGQITIDPTVLYGDASGHGWMVGEIGENGVATAGEITFVLGGGSQVYSVYGYYVYVMGQNADDGINKLLWAETFPTKFTIATTGGEIKVILKLEAD